MDNSDPNFYLMFGRLEGKVDALLSTQSRTDVRLEDVEKRVSDIETMKATGIGAWQTVRTLWVIVAAVAGYFAFELKGYLFK